MQDLRSEKGCIPPKISIGIIVYNGAAHIRNALDNIVRQSYRNIELIVVDGDSKDNTLNILKEYEEHISVLVSEPDQGIYDAMNKICSLATGDWLIFLGCDDVLLDTLGNMVELMTDPDSVYYGDVIFLSSGRVYCGEFSKFKILQQNICHQALFYPREVYNKYSYNLKYKSLADYAYNINLWGDSVPFVYVSVVVSIFNDKGASSQGDVDFLRDRTKLMRASFGNTFVLMESLLSLIDRAVGAVGYTLNFLLPYSFSNYLRSWWRTLRKSICVIVFRL
jgi:glycosyltransferase involved in cell wall biosynthesis